MENNFRLVLIILSGFVISGIFLHGLWTIRKNKKNPYKLRTSNQPIEPIEPVVDKAGFDQDGIGKVKVLKKEPLANDAVSQQPEIQTNNNETLAVQNEQNNVDCAETSVVETPILTEDRSLQGHSQHESIDTLEPHTSKSPEILAFPNMSQDIDMSDELNVGASTPIDSTDINERQEPKISFEEPVIQPKPQRKKLATKAKVDQIEIEFGDPINAPRDIDKPKYKAPKQVEDVEPQVLIISVVAADGNTISGPGVTDMKDGNSIIVYALKALYQQNLLNNANVRVIFNSDEESIGQPIAVSRAPMIKLAKKSDYALSFESSRQANRINALEVGAILDLYYKKIPMMANDFNQPYFFNLYVSLTFGSKKTVNDIGKSN